MPIPVSETDSSIQWRVVMTIISVSPMEALSGVRSSWLTLDTNCDFVFACSAQARLVGSAHVNADDLWHIFADGGDGKADQQRSSGKGVAGVR